MSEVKTRMALPWKLGDGCIFDANGNAVVEIYSVYVSSASLETHAFIVKAVNSHDALVAEVERLRKPLVSCREIIMKEIFDAGKRSLMHDLTKEEGHRLTVLQDTLVEIRAALSDTTGGGE